MQPELAAALCSSGAKDNEFAKWYPDAMQGFREHLETVAMDRIADPQGNRGSDVLLLGMLNAAWPDKYRPRGEPVDDTALDILKELRTIRQQRRQTALPPPIVTVEPAEQKTGTNQAGCPIASQDSRG